MIIATCMRPFPYTVGKMWYYWMDKQCCIKEQYKKMQNTSKEGCFFLGEVYYSSCHYGKRSLKTCPVCLALLGVPCGHYV